MFQNKTEVVKNNFYRLIEKDGIVLQQKGYEYY